MNTFKNLFNMQSMQRFQDSYAMGIQKECPFVDNLGGGLVSPESLVHIDPLIYEKKYAPLALLNAGISIDNTGGYSTAIRSLRVAGEGAFTYSAEKSSDKGVIKLAGEDNLIKVFERGTKAFWSDSELKEAALGGVNLAQRYLSEVLRIYQYDVDALGMLGTDAQTGLLTNTDYSTSAASKTVDNLKPMELYEEMAAFVVDQWNSVNNTPEYMAKVVIVPVDLMNKAMSALLPSATGVGVESTTMKTVWAALQDNFPTVQWMSSAKCSDQRSAVAFSNDIQALRLRIPVPLQVGELVKISSFDYQTDYKYRIGGIDILEKESGAILTGL